MLRKYGEDVVNDLESREFETKRWSEEELLTIKEFYRDKIRSIERGERPTEVPDYSGMEVLDMFKNMATPDSL